MHITATTSSSMLATSAVAQLCCPVTTVELQPLLYSRCFDSPTTIDPFNNGHLVTVLEAPTTVVITSTSAITILPQLPPGCSGISSSATTSQTQTTLTSTSLTTATTSSPTTSSPAFSFGEGLPSGLVTDLPEKSFVFLAVSVTVEPQHRALRVRDATASPIHLVDLAVATGSLSPDSCDQSSPLLLQNGTLSQFGNTVAKNAGALTALLGFLYSNTVSSVDSAFSMVDGVLHWQAADLGTAAVFYDCGDGTIQAGFNQSPGIDCIPVQIGLIAGQVCLDHVTPTRIPEVTFKAPMSSATSSAVSSLSTSNSPTISISTTSTSQDYSTSTSVLTTQTISTTVVSSSTTSQTQSTASSSPSSLSSPSSSSSPTSSRSTATTPSSASISSTTTVPTSSFSSQSSSSSASTTSASSVTSSAGTTPASGSSSTPTTVTPTSITTTSLSTTAPVTTSSTSSLSTTTSVTQSSTSSSITTQTSSATTSPTASSTPSTSSTSSTSATTSTTSSATPRTSSNTSVSTSTIVSSTTTTIVSSTTTTSALISTTSFPTLSSTTSTTTSTTTSPPPYLCPSPTVLVSSDGTSTFDSCANSDRQGNDIYYYTPSSMQDCLNTCASNIECLGVEYRRPGTDASNPSAYCWLKGIVPKSSAAGYIEGLRGNGNRTDTSPCTGQTTQSSPNGIQFIECPNYQRSGTSSGGTTTLNGVTQQQCVAQCGNQISCGGWTYQPAASQCIQQLLPALTPLAGYDMALLRTY